MPFFKVLVEGSGLRMAREDGDAPARGFFVLRIVWSKSEAEAADRAKQAIASDWVSGEHARCGEGPALEVVEIEPGSFFDWLRMRRPGYVFHSERDP